MYPRSVRQDLLELAADYADVCVLVTTAELVLPGPQILYANTAFTRMTGYSVGDLLGKTPRLLQGPDTDRAVLAHLRSTLESGEDFIARTVNYKRDGEPFELEWIISHLRDREGRTTHYIAIQRDITGQQRAAHALSHFDEELREARSRILADAKRLERAEAALRHRQRSIVLGEMAAGVVHDISNALTPVFSLVKGLRAIDGLPLEAQRLSASIDTTIDHAMNVLGNLRSNYLQPQDHAPGPVDLAQLVYRLPELTSARWWDDTSAARTRYRFALAVDAGVEVIGNEVELMQVLVNLVLNAIDVMPEGGQISIALQRTGEEAVLSITDTGPGMSDEMLEQCFEPFVAGRQGGSGLGLAVCRRIVEQHGGRIVATGAAGGGVTFTIRLPLQASGNATSPVAGYRVLVIGGTGHEQQALLDLLQSAGLACSPSSGEDAALAAFFANHYDGVILHRDVAPVPLVELTQILRRARPATRIVWWLPGGDSPVIAGADIEAAPDGAFSMPATPADVLNVLIES